MRIVRVARRPPKSPVVVLHEFGREGVAGFHGANPSKPQLLHEAILQCLVHSLDTTLCLWAVCVYHFYFKLLHCPLKLAQGSSIV
jgi:hypothetical protein